MNFFKLNVDILAIPLLALFLCFTTNLHALPDKPYEKITFSGHPELKKDIWQLAAFLPCGAEENAANRILNLPAASGRPPLTIKMEFVITPSHGFDPALNPWPEKISVEKWPDNHSHPEHLLLEDVRPFGFPKIKRSGEKMSQTSNEAEMLEIIKEANSALSARGPLFEPFEWRKLGDGLAVADISLCYGARVGSRKLHVAKLSPEKFMLAPYHENEYPDDETVDLKGWAARLPNSALLINSGQYEHDRSYIGDLKRDGRVLSGQRHSQWKGFLVSNPGPDVLADAPSMSIIDLEYPSPSYGPEDYLNVMQTLMLLDEKGRIRVNNSYLLASRAAIAQSGDGDIWAIMAPSAMSLYDLAVILKAPELDLQRALCLDGGFEAQLGWQEADGEYFSETGQYLIFPEGAVYQPDAYRSLPSVLVAVPRPTVKMNPVGPAVAR